MADEVVALQLRMDANIARFQKSMDAMRATADRRLTEVEKRALLADRRLSRTMDRAGRNMTAALKSSLSGIAPALAGAFSTAAVLRYADAYTALQNRLKAAGLEGAALTRVEEALYEAANRNGVAVEATAELYQRAAMARQNLGASEEQLLALVSGTTAALKLQGTSAGEASGALLQLGQILGGEKVQAQEYNSLIDQLPVLLQAAADGSDRFGGQIATLTAQVKDGKVTTQEFFAALLKGLGDVEARALSATPTLGAAFQTLNNELGRFVGQTDSGLSATQRLAQGVILLSENLDAVALVVGALATIMGTRYVLALTAATSAQIANGVAAVRLAGFQAAMTASMTGTTVATNVATAAMARFNAMLAANPIGAAVLATAALSAALIYLANKYDPATRAARDLNTAVGEADTVLGEYEAALRTAATATGAERDKALELAAAIRETTVARIQDLRVLAQQRAADAASARAEAAAAQERARRTDNQPRMGAGGFNVVQQGNAVSAQGADRRLVVAETAANAAFDAVKAAEATFAEITAAGGRVTPRQPGSAPDASRSGRSGPSPEDLARQRTLLDLQAEIERLRADGRAAEADAKQDEVDLLNLTKQYEEAGFQNAEAKARAQVTALAASREEARARELAAKQAEGEARALDLMRQFALEMLGTQEELALTDRDALEVRRQILAIRQAERRAALEAAAADADATEAERQAARAALAQLPGLEGGENRALDGSSAGARDAQDIVRGLNPYENAVERAAEAYAEIDRLRQEDVINEQEAALAKAQVDADLREQRLSGTRSMLDTLATLQSSSNKKLAALGKAAAIAQATIDGVLAVQKALASAPPPLNFVQAAIVGAAAAANVASIAGMADGGLVTGPGGPREDKVLRRLSAGEFVVNAAATRQNRSLLEAINRGGVPGLADGGLIGRVTAASDSVLSSRQSVPSSFTYAPILNAAGADRAGLAELRREVREQGRAFNDNYRAAHDRRVRFEAGTRRRK